ncbi:flagellar filament outer layer protein Flaa domain protein [Leptospira interrogans serovar Icterohaemorrhagiae str. Verdun HP]|uniref:Flagellar filament outer layer protein Flaa domain protein n=3 Tax=Leptospira interrogans TaxID=173 RepID=M3IC25_LEPIR|nr:flagellar filament outer layer protein Flaa domain protein [Leptospira interrogans serovar Grippotyphosa str. LT2186]EMG22782.1 flagellar filament outer layer protein Flaa domain protein [Leptospira interrogans serovar Copenhageni str. LT2050]EMN69502.1 flagellar filament outer layer protein Flaa domain protein [Leptospira interrogans serovar Bataviae str. UI 08561]EMO04298.1 flagellar filament outer layer protein Flaa domain protein [Leptospira interrogans serovar Icterohaemorrhagiae str. Ve
MISFTERKNHLFFVILFFILVSLPLRSQDRSSAEIWKQIVVEDFETKEWNSKNLKTKLSKEYLPEIRISTLMLSPERNSTKSLLLEVPAEKNQSFEILWEQTWKTKGFVQEFQFHIYSSGSGASLYVLLRDSTLEVKKILITHLNYEGWKKIRLNVIRKIRQDEILFSKQIPIEFLGLLYEAPFTMKRGTRDLFAIDDILAIVRDKNRMFIDEYRLIR